MICQILQLICLTIYLWKAVKDLYCWYQNITIWLKKALSTTDIKLDFVKAHSRKWKSGNHQLKKSFWNECNFVIIDISVFIGHNKPIQTNPIKPIPNKNETFTHTQTVQAQINRSIAMLFMQHQWLMFEAWPAGPRCALYNLTLRKRKNKYCTVLSLCVTRREEKKSQIHTKNTHDHNHIFVPRIRPLRLIFRWVYSGFMYGFEFRKFRGIKVVLRPICFYRVKVSVVFSALPLLS